MTANELHNAYFSNVLSLKMILTVKPLDPAHKPQVLVDWLEYFLFCLKFLCSLFCLGKAFFLCTQKIRIERMNVFITWCILSESPSTHTHTSLERAVRFEATQQCEWKWSDAMHNVWNEHARICMRKIVLNFIFDCSFFPFSCSGCCWCCVRVFRVPLSALGVWAIENWNEHYVKNICVFVCDIDKMFNTIAPHKSSSSMYFIFNADERKANGMVFLLLNVNISRIRCHWCTN